MRRPRIGGTTATTIVITIMMATAAISSAVCTWPANSDSVMAWRRGAAIYGRVSLSTPIRAAVLMTRITVIAGSLAPNTNIASATRKPIAKAMNVPIITGAITDGVGRLAVRGAKGRRVCGGPNNYELESAPRGSTTEPHDLRVLFRRQRFFNRHLLTFLDGYDAVYRAIPGHGDIEYVASRIQVEVERRSLVEHAAVHHDLRAFGLRLDAHYAHAGGVAVTEHFLESAAGGTDLIGAAQVS